MVKNVGKIIISRQNRVLEYYGFGPYPGYGYGMSGSFV